MNPASVRLLRALAVRRGHVAEIVLAVLEIEGVRTDPTVPDPDAARREAARVRQANSRANRAKGVTVTPGHTDVTRDVTLSSRALLSSDSSEIQQKNETETPEESRAYATVTTLVTDHVTRSVTTNSASDAAFGMLVSSWAGGIRSVTGEDFPLPSGRPGGQLAAMLRKKCTGADPCEDARKLGAEYATARRGAQLSAAWFCEWLGSGKPIAGAGPVAARGVQPVPPGGRAWKVGLSDEEIEQERQARGGR